MRARAPLRFFAAILIIARQPSLASEADPGDTDLGDSIGAPGFDSLRARMRSHGFIQAYGGFEHVDDHHSRTKWIPGITYGFSILETEWTLTLEAPFFTAEDSISGTDTGFGDLKLALGYLWRDDGKWRIATNTQWEFNTSGHHVSRVANRRGEGAVQMVAINHITPDLSAGAALKFTSATAPDPDVPHSSRWELLTGARYNFCESFTGQVIYKNTFEASGNNRHSSTIEPDLVFHLPGNHGFDLIFGWEQVLQGISANHTAKCSLVWTF